MPPAPRGPLKISCHAARGRLSFRAMNPTACPARLAACSWSLQPADPADLVRKLQAAGVNRVQLALDPLRENPATWGDAGQVLQSAGIKVVSGMFGCAGEDYSTLETIRLTGGIAPDATWAENRKNMAATVTLASGLGLRLVTFHAGFLPHDETEPGFVKLLERLKIVAGTFAAENILLGLETGQETAPALAALLNRLAAPNIGVNFDPANMILYDQGDPVQALRVLSPWIRQVHLKDARRTRTPGAWGEEVPLGAGDVDWRGFFAALREMRFAGNFVIEREAGGQRVADIQTARNLFEKLNP